MKPWHLLVTGLYVLLLALLTGPILAMGFGHWPTWAQLNSFFGGIPFWGWLLVMGVCQLVLLTIPVRIASRRPITRGALWPTVLLGSAFITILGLAAALSVHAAIMGDNSEKPWEVYVLAALVVGLWAFWAAAFHRLSRERPPADFLSVLCRRLVQGSILELLVAVPCHVVVRSRDDCCAGAYTMIGLAAGVSVMLFAFGPAVYFLFLARARRLQAALPSPNSTESQP